MKNNRWFMSLMALTAVLVWGSADLASAQPYGPGRGQGPGGGVCLQTPAAPNRTPGYQQGKGRHQGQGQGQQLRRRDASCLNTTPAPAPPAAPPAN